MSVHAARTPLVTPPEQADHRFESMIRHATDMVGICDLDGTIRYISPAVEALLGFTPAEVMAFDRFDRIHPDDVEALWAAGDALLVPGASVRLVYRVQHRDGRWRTFENVLTNLTDDPAVAGLVWNARDVTAQTELECQLRYQALHDPLTHLSNRALLLDRTAHALTGARRARTHVALVLLDIDRFHAVNDAFGPDAGDRLLMAVAARFAGAIRPSDTIARLGGDEFAVLVEEVDGVDAATTAARRLLDVARAPFRIDGHDVFVTASAGLAVTVDGDEDNGRLLRNAHVAMEVAKAHGGDRAEWFEDGMHTQLADRAELSSDLHHAVERRELRVCYQPTIRLADGRIDGAEALLRWHHPVRGPVAPDVFIPVAEASGVIVPIGRWVLQEACTIGRIWQRRQPDFTLAVNLSARQLQDPLIVTDVSDVLRITGLPPANLVLEVTETALADDPDAARARLEELRLIGVRLAIDDFGTGYSSLVQLRSLPVDVVKIDTTFVNGLCDTDGDAYVRAIVNLAHDLRLATVAEGVERECQHQLLRAIGCDTAQGFLFSKAVGAADFDALLHTGVPVAAPSPTVTALPDPVCAIGRSRVGRAVGPPRCHQNPSNGDRQDC